MNTFRSRNRVVSTCFSFALAASLAGCGDEAPDPGDGESWARHHLEQVRDQTPEQQAQYFDELRAELEVARESFTPEALPSLDLKNASEPVAVEGGEQVWCDLSMSGCVNWNQQQGCVEMLICYVCTDGRWNCLSAPINQ